MNKFIIFINKNRFYVAALIIAVVYLFFPNNNLQVDSLGYGSFVKYGENLFLPHHLLYNWFHYLLYTCTSLLIPCIDTLRFMQFINGIFALLCLFLFNKIMKKQTDNNEKSNVWTLFVASCFGVMRYAVDAETYILPIFFSLLSSYFYLDYLKTKRNKSVLFCSIFASVACLFHQIHLFWGIGLFFGFLKTRKLKNVLLFSIPTLSVLVVYSVVLVYYAHIHFSVENLIAYLAEYYYSDDANTAFGMINFTLTPVSFFRTFFQVHGNIINILQLVPVFYVIIPIVVILLGISFYNFKSIKLQKIRIQFADFEFTHLIIFILQFTFAFFSHGNSEFMVMLPFLIPFFIYAFIRFNNKVILYMAFAMLVWNFCFAIYPNNRLDYHNNKELVSFIEKNPDKYFILEEKNVINNLYYYTTGKKEVYRILDNRKIDTIKKLVEENKTFYTDVLTKKMPFNRKTIATSSDYSNIVFVKHVLHIHSDLGGFYIDEIKFKEGYPE